MSKATLVLTIIAKDQPGIVGRVSQIIADAGGNWEQSRMSHLAGWFAGILLVEIDAGRAEALTEELEGLEREGVRLVIERSEGVPAAEGYRQMRLELVGQDHTGIIREISRALADRGVNLEELETSCEDAPMGGGELFHLSALISTPPSTAVTELSGALEALANDLMVDIKLVDPDV